MNEIRLFIFSLQPAITEGIRSFISGEISIRICGESGEKKALSKELRNKKPTALLIDDSGIEYNDIIEIIDEAKSAVDYMETLVYTIKENTKYFGMLYDKGIKALVSKRSSKEVLLDAIKNIKRGNLYIDNYFSAIMLKVKENEMNYIYKLLVKTTKREREILVMLSEGMRNKEIAGNLFISIRTVEVYKSNLSRKLNLSGSSELLRFAVSNREELVKIILKEEYLGKNPY